MSDPGVPDITGEDRAVIIDAESHPRIYELLERLEEIRAQADLLVEENRSITMQLEALVHRTVMFTDPAGVPWRATVVRPDATVNVDLETVKRLDPGLYDRITTTALDRTALNKALRAGAISVTVAEQAMTLRPNSPSVRLTRIDTDLPTEGEEE